MYAHGLIPFLSFRCDFKSTLYAPQCSTNTSNLWSNVIAHCTLHTFYARKQFEFGGKNGMFQELSLHSTEYSSEEETRLNQIDSGKINDWPVFRSNISILNHITQFTVCRFNQVYSQFHQKHSVLCIENICVLSFFYFCLFVAANWN